MTGQIKYRGFFATVEADVDDGLLVGRVQGIADVVSFHATSFAGLRDAFKVAIDDYIETCRKVGKDPEQPASGKLMLRIDPVVHKRALRAAALEGLTLNKWGEKVLRDATIGELPRTKKVLGGVARRNPRKLSKPSGLKSAG